MAIRNWREEDLPFMHQLNQANQPNISGIGLNALTDLVDEADYCRVVELEGCLAAFVICVLPGVTYQCENFSWFLQRYQNFIYLDRVAVAPFAQRQGCGQALYRDLEQFCRQQKITAIALEVNIRPRNDGSLIFHEKLGFVEVGRQETDGGNKTVSLMMKAVPC